MLGRDQLNPKEADYTTTLTKIKALNPEALYYGGVAQAGVKVVKQSYDIIPNDHQGRRRRHLRRRDPEGRRLPGGAGLVRDDRRAERARKPRRRAVRSSSFAKKYGKQPDNYSITAYDAALVILDAIKRVAASGKEVTRDAVRDAIQTSHVKTLQGEVSFDANGDIENRIDQRLPDYPERQISAR